MSNDKIFAPKGSAARLQIINKAAEMFEDSDIHVNRRRLKLVSTFNRGTGERLTASGRWVSW